VSYLIPLTTYTASNIGVSLKCRITFG